MTTPALARDAVDGPNLALSRRAFTTWTHGWTHSADFTTSASLLPPTFIAVGRRDALLREARALNEALASANGRHELVEYDTGHGFLGDVVVRDDALEHALAFFQT